MPSAMVASGAMVMGVPASRARSIEGSFSAVLEPPRSHLRPGQAVHAAIAVRNRAPGGQPPGRPHHVPERRHAARRLAGPVPAQGRPAGLGKSAPGPARRPGGGGLMPLDELHREVAVIALRAAASNGFALAGGCALLAHGVTVRPTEDVDLFTNHEHGVQAAADVVEASLRAAGFETERQDEAASLADVFEGMGDGLAEWIITAPGGRQMMLQMSYFDRGHQPVIMDIGPVLDLDDVVGGKVCALASRAVERDYVDT